MADRIKVKISSFVANVLENDALKFGFTKNEKLKKVFIVTLKRKCKIKRQIKNHCGVLTFYETCDKVGHGVIF